MWRETQQQRKRWKSRGKILGGNRKDERSTALLLELTWRSPPQWAPANKACARVLACVSTYTKPADHERAPISKRNLWQKNFFAGRIQRLGLAGDARGSRWHLKLLPLLASVSAHLATGDTITHHACTDAQSLERTRVRKKNLSRALSHQGYVRAWHLQRVRIQLWSTSVLGKRVEAGRRCYIGPHRVLGQHHVIGVLIPLACFQLTR